MSDDPFRRNAILGQLPEAEYARLRPVLRLEQAEMKQTAYEPGVAISRLYFPLSAVYSLVGSADGRLAVEVATIGHEGFVGLPVYLGAATSPQTAFCQVPGDTAAIDAEDFRRAMARDGGLHALLGRYTQTTMVQISQNVICNRSHPAEQRMARWLLTTHDRVGRDEFPLTQEFLAQMLGVHRPTVSETAQRIQAGNMIHYRRGVITITDRQLLEQLACDCYRIVKAEFDAIINYRGEGR
ncbi:Crp/Fnr family transcriptional regulator [Mycolicibacter algericus]|uniref:Crp/Fnr family transcriptional regulator n=1 Tax=Mycolicibacter algericus TaxID=1288388 RepID=UPI003C763BD8